jgi:hypothetical protein
MPVDERARHELYLAFEHLIGAQKADTLMAMLPPVGWADVATKRDLDALRAATKQDIESLREATKHDIDVSAAELRTEIAGLRADMERGFREQARTWVTWLLASQASTVALVVAAIAFFR